MRILAAAVWVQVDTFEAVKNNVYSVLGDLAKDLHGPELDLLFSKFEACTGWPAPDTLKAMDLLKRLAHSDDEASFLERHPQVVPVYRGRPVVTEPFTT